MMRLRLFCGLMVLAGILAPGCVAWLAMRQVIVNREATTTPGTNDEIQKAVPKTPNPARVPLSYLNPLEQLVYVDPWFAGAILPWVLPLGVLSAGWLLAAVLLVRPGRRGNRPPWLRRVSTLCGVSVILGLLLAAPWFYGLCQVLMRSRR